MNDNSELDRYDPKQLIREALELEDSSATTARDCVLLWLLSLEDGVDPAEAASGLLRTVLAESRHANPLRDELAVELAEVSRHPRAGLLAGSGRRRRRSTHRS